MIIIGNSSIALANESQKRLAAYISDRIQQVTSTKYIVMKVKECSKKHMPGYGKVAVTLSTGKDIWAIFQIEDYDNGSLKLKPLDEFRNKAQHTWWPEDRIMDWMNEGLAFFTDDLENAKVKYDLITK